MSRVVALVLAMAVLAAIGVNLVTNTALKPEACLQRVRPAPSGRFAAVVSAHDDSLEIEYDDGMRLRVPRRPRRIVSTLPGITEMLDHLGAVDRLVAVSKHCDRPARVRQLRTVGVHPLDVEVVLDVRADLVILDRRLHRPDLETARRQVGNVLILDTSHSLASLATSFDLLARTLFTPRAEQAARKWHAALRAAERVAQEQRVVPPPKILIVMQWDPLIVGGPGSLLDDLARTCGCINIACDLKAGASGRFSEEVVLSRLPDWIVVPHGEIPDAIFTRWAAVPAIERDRFLDGSGDEMVRGGPRILDGLAAFSSALWEGDQAPDQGE